MMGRPLFAATTAAAIALSAPAAAQYGGQADTYGRGADNFAERIDQLESRLEDGIDAGTINRREALSIRPQIRQFVRLEARYSYDGLNRSERQDLQQRLRSLRQELRVADGRANRYRDWDDEDRYGYGDGPSGRYREVSQACFQPSGIQAIFGALLGADNCLRVGDPVNVNLSAVPTQYRDEFRDTSRSYFRYLEGNVIEVDNRSRTVARIYQVN